MRAARKTDWGTKPLPEERCSIPLDRSFNAGDMEFVQRGVLPEVMEDKWFVYWADGALHLHRSWTGVCVYIVHFFPEDDGWSMAEVWVNRDPEQYGETDDRLDARLIDYLIDVLLLRREREYPDQDESPDVKTLKAWGLIGRAMLGQHPGEGLPPV